MKKTRQFETGATRDSEEGKIDYEGFLCPMVLERYGQYMNKHRIQSDGQLRASDNWQAGIPISVYIKSLLRHVWDVWMILRGHVRKDPKDGHVISLLEACCAALFNVMGIMHETLKVKQHEENPTQT